jgi:hypothetical protein
MIKIKNEGKLLETLVKDVNSCDKEKIVFFAGHFPLIYTEEKAIEAIEHWGEFSTYSLELACTVGKYAKKNGKEIEFVFFVDDHSYSSKSFNDLGSSKIKTRRNRLYKEKSGENAQLDPIYQKIMEQHGFNENNVIHHDHKKNGREQCLYFSEIILRSSARKIDNGCAKEYTEFIEDPKYFDKDKSHLISFIPNRCQLHICNVALDKEINNLSASHVFMETTMPTTKEELYQFEEGVTYRKD